MKEHTSAARPAATLETSPTPSPHLRCYPIMISYVKTFYFFPRLRERTRGPPSSRPSPVPVVVPLYDSVTPCISATSASSLPKLAVRSPSSADISSICRSASEASAKARTSVLALSMRRRRSTPSRSAAAASRDAREVAASHSGGGGGEGARKRDSSASRVSRSASADAAVPSRANDEGEGEGTPRPRSDAGAPPRKTGRGRRGGWMDAVPPRAPPLNLAIGRGGTTTGRRTTAVALAAAV